READRAVATGEALSAAVLAAALEAACVRARSLTGAEAGVAAEGPFGAGAIRGLDAGEVRRLLAAGVVPVVAGFQGVRADGETVTLGRGASDTTAVALAAALGAECHLVTDVSAVHDRDPRLDPGARPLREIGADALVALTEAGARVVHPAAARLARDRGVPLRVYGFRASLSGAGGTVVRAPGSGSVDERGSDRGSASVPDLRAAAGLDRAIAPSSTVSIEPVGSTGSATSTEPPAANGSAASTEPVTPGASADAPGAACSWTPGDAARESASTDASADLNAAAACAIGGFGGACSLDRLGGPLAPLRQDPSAAPVDTVAFVRPVGSAEDSALAGTRRRT
ncbi:MAG: aspartate kinase, partial [Gemmatimonadetes bacterium]|nr:aspartate kinase [Gemmatimonadota bacterium]